ncbi:MAG: dicarboxylate/amino acid:cation symporter [Bacteroidales bacterium]|nr:dicarboxylate/amino acid:cation symporter [Bacteroidales bacterium]
MKSFKIPRLPLLLKIAIAIVLGIGCSFVFPMGVTRIFVTINGIFGNFLSFIIPLIIVALIVPGVADLGKSAGNLLGITALIAYGSTVFAGFLSYFTCRWTYPSLLSAGSMDATALQETSTQILPYFTIEMPPVMGVMSALILAFVLGLGLAAIQGNTLRNGMCEFRDLTVLVIEKVIIPLLPLYIFGIFLKIGAEGQIASVMGTFIKVIVVIFALHILLLLIQFCIAGAVAGKNPIKALMTMLPAYATALGTQSSAATIPVTLKQAIKNGVNEDLAGFVIPLCATIHLAGSTLKITACAYAISLINGLPIDISTYGGFILMLGITMVAAPGVPGGAIMAALGVLATFLGFDENTQGLMIALYIAMDSFGTACNVTGDGAIALVVNRINQKRGKRNE